MFNAANLALFFYISKSITDKKYQWFYNQCVLALFFVLTMPKKDVKKAKIDKNSLLTHLTVLKLP